MIDFKEKAMYHRGMADALEGKKAAELADEQRGGLKSLIESYNKGFRDGLEKRLGADGLRRQAGTRSEASSPRYDPVDAEIAAINAERFENDEGSIDRSGYDRLMREIGADYEETYGFDPGEK